MKQITEVVDNQLRAYNELDFETFALCYHKDIVSYELETGAGIEKMSGEHFFAHYRKKFKENPEIHCKVVQRMIHGNLVVDKEYITACNKRNHHEMVIYKIESGLITKMWFTEEIGENN